LYSQQHVLHDVTLERHKRHSHAGAWQRLKMIVIPECLYRGSSLFTQSKSGFPKDLRGYVYSSLFDGIEK
jgi:hypothetical protein